jgi:hypothetical protein
MQEQEKDKLSNFIPFIAYGILLIILLYNINSIAEVLLY